MKAGFYPKLTWDGIKKNKRIYIPYILTGCIMVMMTYIISYLSTAEILKNMKGASTFRFILPMGEYVVLLFSLIFLFYSSSFMIRQRSKEFGLYSVLGMDKRNLSALMLWESVFTGGISILVGLIIGVIFSKFAELALCNLMKEEISYSLHVNAASVWKTALYFVVIYVILFLASLIKVKRMTPLAMLKDTNAGEKPPRANWFLAVMGVIILAAAYYIALSIEQPLAAMVWFFAAVILVIIASYLLFIAGSVAVCRLLQKNKNYYYKPDHFVAVSSMAYRMKRNGAGLASICILITMVLVMLTSTISLYAGCEDAIEARYPNDINMNLIIEDIENFNQTTFDAMREKIDELVPEKENVVSYSDIEMSGMFTDEGITIDMTSQGEQGLSVYEKLGNLHLISLDDYNRIMGTNEELNDGECLICCYRTEYSGDTFTIENCDPLTVKGTVDDAYISIFATAKSTPTIYVITSDPLAVVQPVSNLQDAYGMAVVSFSWSYNFDMDADSETIISVKEELEDNMEDIIVRDSSVSGYGYSISCKEEARAELYGMYAGFLFVGVLLSVVFLFAAILIIYYKQVTEGFEDEKRFEVMQKVGMTKKNIKKTINSQILIVFFAPLVLAGIHLAFAFPMIWKLMQLFLFSNEGLMIRVTVINFLAFALVYAIVYKLTSGVYYSIVSGNER